MIQNDQDDMMVQFNSSIVNRRWYVLPLRKGPDYIATRLDYLKYYHRGLITKFNEMDIFPRLAGTEKFSAQYFKKYIEL